MLDFFETGHGKGEHDGVKACVKRALRRYQMNHYADRFVCSNQVVQWCHLNLSHDYNQQSKDVHRYELCFQNRIIQLRITLICTCLLTFYSHVHVKLFMLDRFFWHIGIQDIDKSIPYDASIIHGTQYLHDVIVQIDQHTQINR